MEIKIQILDENLPYPRYAHPGDAGLDLCSTINTVIKPFERKLIPTGIKIEIPEGYAGFIQPRSGLAVKHGVSLVNTPGLIDCGYRGEIKAILINFDKKDDFKVKRGDRICQLVIMKIEHANLIYQKNLSKSDRGEKGFGSSGLTIINDGL